MLGANSSCKPGPLKAPLRVWRLAGFVLLFGVLAGLLAQKACGAPVASDFSTNLLSRPPAVSAPPLESPMAAQPDLSDPGAAAPPRRITPGQTLPAEADGQWAEVEGEVTFASEQAQGLVLELSSSMSHMRVEVAESAGASPLLLLHSRLRAAGRCRVTMTLEGDHRAGTLLVPGLEQLQVLEWAAARWAEYPLLSIGSLPRTNFPAPRDRVVHVRGKVAALQRDRVLALEDETGQILVETLQTPLPAEGAQVEVLGRWGRRGTNVVLRGGGFRESAPKDQAGPVLPQLTRVEQIKSLSAAEAQRGYPVRIRGIVTGVLQNGFFIQDATWAIYVSCAAAPGRRRPRAGEFWEVEGVTYEGFAPSILPGRMAWVATGTMPEPLHPTWDQLINGSLDAQYVEVQGIVTWTLANEMSLLTRSGKIRIRLVETPPRSLKGYENALIRVRGCVIPDRNASTMQVDLGRIELSNYLITMDEPAPADPFAARLRRVSELLLFNWRASAIERIRTAGQVVHGRQGEYYLMEGTNGLRFLPKTAQALRVGEQVEVVGFPGLGGPSPVLREALVRSRGWAHLPAARLVPADALLSRDYDATLVQVQARLVNASLRRSEQVLELQAGTYGFLARLEGAQQARRDLLPGSRLELVGVYAAQGGDRASGRAIDSFELLLNSPADIHVLEQPSWWTLQRVLWVLGATSLLAVLSLGWVATLQREVHRQTGVIQQKIEREAVLEERTRIAREFHDTIEQQVAAVTLQLQAARARLDSSPGFVRHVLQLAESMLRHTQSEARHSVWNLRAQALENGNLAEALQAVANYARNGAEVRTEVSVAGPARPLPGRFENHLLRISQEAIANAVKHGAAKNIRIGLRYGPDTVQLVVTDDGKGFATAAAPSGAAGHFGLLGLRERAEKIGGTLTVTSVLGRGTEISLTAPLPAATPTASHTT